MHYPQHILQLVKKVNQLLNLICGIETRIL
jgi:hypothetical protein